MSTTFGQKLRLNVVALIDEVTVGRLLVCIDDEALIEDLSSKVRGALAKSNVEGHLLRLTNRFGANLPSDEKVGDVMRDAEEVVAVLTAEPEDPVVRQQLLGGVGEIMSFARAAPDAGGAGNIGGHRPALAANVYGTGPRLQQRLPSGGREEFTGMPFSGGEESFQTVLPITLDARQNMRASHQTELAVAGGVDRPTAPHVPGPAETFEEDLVELPPTKGGDLAVQSRLPSGSDWTVEGLSPKLREYISTRFREAHISAADPGNSFIAVTMRPRARTGAVPSQPIHYSIARIDIVEFERLCGQKVQEIRCRADHFRRCQQALTSLMDKGASGSQYVANMLPYRYRAGEEFSDLLSEADMPTFGQVEGCRPTIVIDNSGVVGESLVFIRSALKRILYSFIVAKSKFNLVKFSPQGNPVAWANGMVQPTAQVLREAEEFLDGIRPVRHNHSSNLLEGVQLALAHPEADAVYVLSSGLPRRCSLEIAVRSLRSMNIRDLPLHIVGVECEPKAELELRRLAEDNHGSFRHKRFSPGQNTFASTLGSSGSTEVTSRLGRKDNDDARLTISGQLSILEIMIEEQEMHTVDWLEEQKCATRLLFTTASQQPVPDWEQARGIYQRAALTDERRLMGDSQSRLQELVEAHVARGSASPAAAAGYLGPGAERRRVAQAASQRASSQPCAAGDAARRPSVVNPWDRPGAVIKTSQFISKGSRGTGLLPPTGTGRPGSARGRRPASASRAASPSARHQFA
jgi:hypothetical protein